MEQNRRVETKNKFMELQPSAAAEKTIYMCRKVKLVPHLSIQNEPKALVKVKL